MGEYRASELGACLKAQAARRLGYTPLPPPEKFEAIFERGNLHETMCVDAMHQFGYSVFSQQQEIVIPVGAVQIVGHIDGMVEEYGVLDDRVLEIKAPGAWQKFHDAQKTGDWSDPLAERYAWQISVYMHALQTEALIACLDGETIRTFVIEVAPYTLDDIYRRVVQIEDIVRSGTLPAECSVRNYPCPFVYLHEDPDVETDDELDQLAAAYQAAADAEKTAKAQKDQFRDALMRHMADRGTVDTERFRVKVYQQAGPSRFSEEKMIADGINPDDYRVAGQLSPRIRITGKGEQ
jgi:hypothetical protein